MEFEILKYDIPVTKIESDSIDIVQSNVISLPQYRLGYSIELYNAYFEYTKKGQINNDIYNVLDVNIMADSLKKALGDDILLSNTFLEVFELLHTNALLGDAEKVNILVDSTDEQRDTILSAMQAHRNNVWKNPSGDNIGPPKKNDKQKYNCIFFNNYDLKDVETSKYEQIVSDTILKELSRLTSRQKLGGTLILQLYDTVTNATAKMVAFMFQLYSNISIYRPFSASSTEATRYLICTDFYGEKMEEILDVFKNIKEHITDIYSTFYVDQEYIDIVKEFNLKVAIQNSIAIEKTLIYLNRQDLKSGIYNSQYEKKIKNAQKWLETFLA